MAYGSGNAVGKEENGESTQKLPEVGTADDDLRPSASLEDTFGKGRGK